MPVIPTEETARKLFSTWGYDTLIYETTENSAEILLRSRVDNTHTVRRFEPDGERWVAVDSDAWR